MIRLLFFILLIFYLPLAQAKNLMFYFGSGGEDKTESQTIFDQGFGHAIDFAQKNNWDAKYYSTYEHSENMDIAKDKKIGSQEFITENIRKQFEDIEMQIKNGTLKQGDQILLVLNTHGDVEGEDFAISTADNTFLPENYLRRIIQAAEERDIKIGLTGLTCFSGQLQNFGSDKTCAISVSSSNTLGYIPDSDNILDNFKNSKNLEEAFNKGRKTKKVIPSRPEISTIAGKKATATLNHLKEYFEQQEGWTSKIKDSSSCKNYENLIKQFENSLNEMEKQIFATEAKKKLNATTIQKFRELVVVHERNLASAHFVRSDLVILDNPCFMILDENGLSSNVCAYNESTAQEIAEAFQKKADKYRAAGTKSEWTDTLQRTANFMKKKVEIFKKTKGVRAEFLKPVKESAAKLQNFEREVYDQLYEMYSKDSSEKEPNPCRDFKL